MAHPLLCWDIIQEGMGRRKEFASDIDALDKLVKKNKWQLNIERTLDNCIVWENKTIIVTNTNLNIVFASKNMYKMNGYKPNEVIGQNPKIFQGLRTTNNQKRVIKTAVSNLKPFDTVITNYRKDGSIYDCHIEGYPVYNIHKQLINFIALETIV